MRKIIIHFFLIALMFPSLVHSQSLIGFPSPNAASLGQYGQVGVNLFNGLPNIEIPLHKLVYKDITVPVNLSYHASGIRVDDYPGWVGLGWTLHAGGNITRIVNGLPDEITAQDLNDGILGTPYSTNQEYSYFFRSKDMDTSNWTTNDFLEGYFSGQVFRHIPWDAEPDEFMFNVGDFSGSFFMVRNAQNQLQIKMKSKSGEHLKVEPLLTSSVLQFDIFKGVEFEEPLQVKAKVRRTFISFVMTRADGTKYTFGGHSDAIDFNTVQREEAVRTTASTWYLTKIESPKGNNLNFEYKKEGDVFIQRRVRQLSCSNIYDPNSCTTDNLNYEFSNLLQHPSYLSRIVSERGTEMQFVSSPSSQLSFDYSNGHPRNTFTRLAANDEWHDEFMQKNYWLKLDEIIVTGLFNIKLNYNNIAQQRLRLSKVDFEVDDNNYNYSFKYNAVSLPGYNSKKSDNWGFYNNKNYDHVSFGSLFNYRAANINYAKAETLEEIVYPTGGISKFDYELHSYSQIAQQYPSFSMIQQNGVCGGLRIQRISSYVNSDDKNPVVKEYSYKNIDGSSSGILSGIPKYEISGRKFMKVKISDWSGLSHFGADFEFSEEFRMQSESWLLPLGKTNGSHITYSQVTEKNIGNGYTVYKYTNHHNRPDEEPVRVFGNVEGELINTSFTSKEIERGLLTEEKTYDIEDKLIKKVSYVYNSNPGRYEEYIKALNYFIFPGFIQDYVRCSAYKIYTFYPFIQEKIERTYFNNDSLELITKYQYDSNYRLLKEEKQYTSKGDSLVTMYEYPFDYSGTTVYNEMTAANVVNPIIQKAISYNGTVPVESVFTGYKKLPNGTFVPDYTESKKGSESNGVRDEYEYDSRSNLITVSRLGGTKTNYIWSYDSEFPVAKVENAQYEDLVSVLGGQSAIDTLRDTPLPSNPLNSLLSLRSNSLLKNSLISTYTYTPRVGITSEMDTKGNTIYYEYDSFGRLTLIRDQDNKIVKSYCYNYAGQPMDCTGELRPKVFKNDKQSAPFSRYNCLPGYIGGDNVIYEVPEGKYSSSISKADANLLAQQDLNINGPIYASTKGPCLPIIYVKLERQITDLILLDGSEYDDQTLYEMRGNLIAHFYWDEAKTRPINVTGMGLELILSIDPAADFYPPLSNPYIIEGEDNSQILFSDIQLAEEFSERDMNTMEFRVLWRTNYNYDLLYSPRYIVVN